MTLNTALAQVFTQREKGKVTVRLVYSDKTGAGARASAPHIEVRYDNGASGGAVAIDTSRSGRSSGRSSGSSLATIVAASPSSWHDVRVDVTGAVFTRGGTNGADVWISNKGSDAAILHMVEVTAQL